MTAPMRSAPILWEQSEVTTAAKAVCQAARFAALVTSEPSHGD